MHFDTVTRVSDLQEHFCDNFSSVDFIYLIPFFSRMVWIDTLHNLMMRFFLNKGYHRNRKNYFFSYRSNNSEDEKCIIKNMNLIDIYYHWKNLVDWISNMATSKMYSLRKTQKLKNINFTSHDYLPQFCSENRNWLSYKDGYIHLEN